MSESSGKQQLAEISTIVAWQEVAIENLHQVECAAHRHPWSLSLLQSCEHPRYFKFVAIHKDKVLGFYIADVVAEDVSLMDICVHPDYQQQGIAGKLMHHLFEQSRERGAETLWLEVRASNQAAISLYQKWGFTQQQLRRNYYQAEEGKEDALVMQCPL